MKKILVTGASGYIGSHTCLLLLNKGYEVFALDSFVNSSLIALERVRHLAEINNSEKNKLHIYRGDIRHKETIRKIFSDAKDDSESISSVIHFAGLKSVFESINAPLEYWDVNVNGTLTLLKVMEENACNTFVFSSSATIYGYSNSKKILEDSNINPLNTYGKTKSCVETILKDLYLSYPSKWNIACLRYFNPIGAHPSGIIGEDPMGIPNNLFPFITQVALGKIKELKIFGNDWPTKDGTGIRDYIHVMDVAEGHLVALEFLKKEKNNIFNINLGTGLGTSVLELVKSFEKVNKIKIPYIFSARRPGDVCTLVADNSLAQALLNWSPRRTIDEMCKDGWEWQMKNPRGFIDFN